MTKNVDVFSISLTVISNDLLHFLFPERFLKCFFFSQNVQEKPAETIYLGSLSGLTHLARTSSTNISIIYLYRNYGFSNYDGAN